MGGDFSAVEHGSPHDFRRAAIACDALASEELALARLWHELTQGTCRIVDSFFTPARCFVVTAGSSARPQRPLQRRSLEILETVLLGEPQKSVCVSLGLAASTVTLDAQKALEWLGLRPRVGSASPLLMLAVKAARDGEESVLGRVSADASQRELSLAEATRAAPLRVVSIARPELCLADQLPRAELEIVRYLVEGRCHAEMARLRGTSPRTIANQIGSVFRRFQVTGRVDLVLRVLEMAQAERAAHGATSLVPKRRYRPTANPCW